MNKKRTVHPLDRYVLLNSEGILLSTDLEREIDPVYERVKIVDKEKRKRFEKVRKSMEKRKSVNMNTRVKFIDLINPRTIRLRLKIL